MCYVSSVGGEKQDKSQRRTAGDQDKTSVSRVKSRYKGPPRWATPCGTRLSAKSPQAEDPFTCYTNSPSSVYLRCRCVAFLDVRLSTPASSPRCRLGLHLECKSVLLLWRKHKGSDC